ncbi:tRNA dimethylallyltransferase [Anseongella ginsenosidimutans]|uniref:tRNA dimethylallyltransferase n=1 Tax=Anseongella ginsenosidimutans TaxID=496056 RepID=A0A4R3KT39_9SPHI|nr:tRNA (adenosine(37)-N6)-dimethylallyltransferase MiaA [Anseongella ginsenosidimutans]QEC52335.1 tRNA (adenosine(37)-N6)-dimethylallyltransferase MiaA [Anseongella ginsenosidimutans]TCS86901.1 tRNA dimethylallyltransferase [Anseongella ginsenosidimutans]
MSSKILIVISGPTASGKTALSIELARHYQTEIISADSRQFYRELPIGTAQPSATELAAAPHHFIASRSVFEELNAGRFEAEALELISRLFKVHDQLILTGGSGLFIDAVCRGLDELPRVNPGTREALNQKHREEGLHPLQEMLREADPVYYEKIDLNNPQRVIRALEVFISSGKPYSSFLKENAKPRPFRIQKFAIDLERSLLYERINARVDAMLSAGLVEEARKVYPYRHLKTLETVGYAELFEYFDGHISLEEAVELIKRNTRRFAKRQVTWLKRDPEVIWVRAGDFSKIPLLVASGA